jgi:hypothetical protein
VVFWTEVTVNREQLELWAVPNVGTAQNLQAEKALFNLGPRGIKDAQIEDLVEFATQVLQ